jgi:C4-dicarboxylate-specific signal transduction histidine kinase
MKELITVAASFILVVGLALFMYMGNQKHTTAVMENQQLKELVDKNHDALKLEISRIDAHLQETDSIFHNRKTE